MQDNDVQHHGIRLGRMATAAAVAVFAMTAAWAAGPEGSTSAAQSARPLETVRVISAADLSGVAYAPITSVPLTQGYWAQAGVNVAYNTIVGGAAAFQALTAGQADIVYAGTSPWFPFLATGANVPVICNVTTKFINTPMVPTNSAINTVQDLKGKNIGVSSLESSQVPLITAMLKSVGLSASDVHFVAIPAGQAAIATYRRGGIDVFGYFDTQQAQMDQMLKAADGGGLRPLQIPKQFSSLAFEGAFFVSPAYLASRRDAVVGFLKGVAQGYVYAAANPTAAVKLHWQQYPASKPTTGVEADNLALHTSLLKARLANSDPVDGLYCNTPVENVQAEMQVFLDAGVLKQPVDASKHVNNDLVKDVNAFDRQAIVSSAQAAR